ncbi:hypothetical protein HK098_002765 [Nowakowskiella sp. JEL0407]|nr:hypothetical protein HK098_002765 [Nowakowskiella sp. JEL0407]
MKRLDFSNDKKKKYIKNGGPAVELDPYCITGTVTEIETKTERTMIQIRKKVTDNKNLDKETPKRMWKEFRKQQNIALSNMTRVIDTFETRTKYYIILEKPQGVNLIQMLTSSMEGRRFTENDAARIIHKVLSALEVLHRHGVVHRHINHETIFMQSPETSEIILSTIWPNNYIRGDKYGVCYASPETIRFFRSNPLYFDILYEKRSASKYISDWPTNAGTQSDIWSVGCLAYLLLRGYHPFHQEEDREGLIGDLISIEKKWEFDQSAVNFGISDQAKDFVENCLNIDFWKRPDVTAAKNHPWLSGALNESDSELPNLVTLWNMPFVETKKLTPSEKFKKMVIRATLVNRIGGIQAPIELEEGRDFDEDEEEVISEAESKSTE